MAGLSLKLAGYPWDHITPLLTGDVKPEGIDLQYDTDHGLSPVSDDPSCAGGEASLGRFMLDTSRGDRSYVGLPIFPMFAFRHRCFLVKRGTKITDLKELEGKRVGLDGWPNSGNTWTRVTLGQAGVDIWKINWVVAPIEGPGDAGHGTAPADAPSNVVTGPAGKSLVDLTLSGDLDVMVAAFMPSGFFSPDSPIVPMFPDYPAHETAYFKKHGYVPAHHIIKLHREVVERDPWIVKSLMTAFTASKKLWIERRRHLADTTPFLLADIVKTAEVFGDDWQPYGLEPNLKMLTDFTQDQFRQKLVAAPVDPKAAFADAARLLGEGG
jgi:4,5-dihydroxyphthalate decarboxylase